MSQEKVNRYKAEKANRKAILKKEKRKKIITRVVGTLVCVAIVGWIGFSIYDSAEKKAAASQTEVNLNAVTDYLSGLSAAEAAEEDTAEE